MGYTSLYKTSFTRDVEKDYWKRIVSDCTFSFTIGPYQNSSFVMMCDESKYLVNEIEILTTQLSKLHAAGRKNHEMIADEIICTNMIEGISCSKEDVDRLRKLYDELLLNEIRSTEPENLPDGTLFRKDPLNVGASYVAIHTGVYPERRIIFCMDTASSVLNNDQMPYPVRIALFLWFYTSLL